MEYNNFDLFDGHRERLRVHIEDNDSLDAEQHELIEFLLYYIFPRQDMNDMAHALVERFGSAKNVLLASEDELLKVEGLGEIAAEWLSYIGRGKGMFEAMNFDDIIHVNTFRQSLDHIQYLRRMKLGKCTAILCMNSYGWLISQHFVYHSGTWSEQESMIRIMDYAVSSHCAQVVIISFLENRDIEPTEKELEYVGVLAGTMSRSRGALADFIHVCGSNVFSLRKADMIRGEKDTDFLRAVCERYTNENPEEDDCSDIKGRTL